MLILGVVGVYLFGALCMGRYIYGDMLEQWEEQSTRYRENHAGPYAYSVWGLMWPFIILILGWGWFVSGKERKQKRVATKANKQQQKVEAQRVAEKKRLDALCEPWHLTLRDQNATDEQKDFAREILRGLVLEVK